MKTVTLDQYGAMTPSKESEKPLIINDAHAFYLYEQSYDRMVEKRENAQIEEFIQMERAEKQAHKEYTEKNYIRVGGN